METFEDCIAEADPLFAPKAPLVFDYCDVDFATIDAHVHALMLYNQLAAVGREVLLEWPHGDARSYAERMGFFAALDERVEVDPYSYRDAEPRRTNTSLLEITPFQPHEQDSLDPCLELIRERAGGAIQNRAVTNDFTNVAQEILTNAQDWSETRIAALAAVQRYRNRVAITIGDGGVGIIGSLRKNLPLDDTSDDEILTRVFREGLSSRTKGGGAGLMRCVEITAKYEGRLTVRTNRIWSKLIVRAKRGGKNWTVWNPNSALIPGTILTFDLLEERW